MSNWNGLVDHITEAPESGERLTESEAAKERAAIVAWLRDEREAPRDIRIALTIGVMADAIERGEHVRKGGDHGKA